jgi:hypothetical protein
MKTARSVKRQFDRHRTAAPSGLLDASLWQPESAASVLKRLTVIGPYPTEEFFRTFLATYKPKEILLVVDDGCNRDVIDRIGKLCKSRKFEVRCASCGNRGLLHAKVYLTEWVTGSKTKRRLLWGSMNASQNGFQVNGEVASAVTLDPDQERAVLAYLRPLWEQPSGSVRSLDMILPGGVRFLLPEFEFFARSPEPKTFDAWIQAGYLCYKFQRDQSFAKLSVKLLQPLPKDAIEQILAEEGLRADSETDLVRYAYLGDVVRDEGKRGPHWRASYFVETWLGFWTSDSCYTARKNEFVAHNEHQRKEVLTLIKQATPQHRQDWCDRFTKRLWRVLTRIEAAGLPPPAYFQMRANDLDVRRYRANALKELESHYKRARNGIFEERFTKGYEFPPLPRFRGAEAVEGGSFEDFVESFCETILNGLVKRKSPNNVVQTIRRCLSQYAGEMQRWTGRDLLKVLRRDWHKIGPEVQRFYKSVIEAPPLFTAPFA